MQNNDGDDDNDDDDDDDDDDDIKYSFGKPVPCTQIGHEKKVFSKLIL